MTKPIFVYAAVPAPATKVIDLFSDSPVRSLLEKPGGLRYAGWDLQTLDSARIVEGEYLQVRNGDRKVINLYKNGVLLVRADATDDLLAWGGSESHPGILRLNPLAVVEFSYSFVQFYVRLLQYLSPRPSFVTLRLQIENAKGDQTLYMFPYGVNAMGWKYPLDHDRHPAPSERLERESMIGAEQLASQPAVCAYWLVEEIYAWFGLRIEEIPYVKTQDGVRMIDVEAIVRGGN